MAKSRSATQVMGASKSTKENATQKRPASSSTTSKHVRPLQERRAEPPEIAALLAKIAKQEGKSFTSPNLFAHSHLAEIERFKKAQAAKSTKPLEEILRPSKIENLQRDMGLADNKKLYLHCRVSYFLLPRFHLYL